MTRQEIQARKKAAEIANQMATIQDNLRVTGDTLFEGVYERREAVQKTIEQVNNARTRVFGSDLSSGELYVANQRKLRGCAYSSFRRF